MNKWKLIGISVAFWVLPFIAFAQLESLEDLEKTTKKGFFKTYFKDAFKGFTDFGDPFTVSGGVGLNLRSYDARGGALRQDPFFYSLNTNINFRIYKLNIPFSLIVTARNSESSLPNLKELADALKNDVRNNVKGQRDRFIRFGMSPHYKWMKLHLGHRSMNFSKFTLANLNFFGVGTELTPGNVRVAAMYGRLAKAEPLDISLTTPNVPIYERIGWGTKLGYGTEQQSIDLMIFQAHDDPNSIAIPTDSEEQPSPQDNLTLGLNFQKLFFKRFRLKAETALSALSPNALDAESDSGNYPGFLFTERNTTDHNTAIDAGLNYEGKKFNAGVQFKRIDSNYKSLGAYFFNNDIVQYLGNLDFGLLDGKMNVALSGGVASNNLDLLKPTTTNRLIYSADLSYALDAFSANANYSNNTTDVGYVLNQELDSLNAVIITQSAGLNFNYTISADSSMQHVFTLGGNLQEVGDDIENPLESATSEMWVGHFVYNLILPQSKWRFTTRANYNQNELAQMKTNRYGAGMGISKSLFEDKMNVGVDFNYYYNTNEINSNSTNLNGQLRWGYNIGNGLTANLNFGVLRTESDNIDPFTELTGNLGIRYNFNIQPKSKRKEKKQKEKEAKANKETELSQTDVEDQPQKLSRKERKKKEEEAALKAAAEQLAIEENQRKIAEEVAAEQQRLAEEEQLKKEAAARKVAIEQERLAREEQLQREATAKATKEESGVSEFLRMEKRKAEEKKNREAAATSISTSTTENLGIFTVTKATSLRESPNSEAKVLKRLKTGGKVTVVEKTEQYWWKVSSQDQTGYVKALFLKK